MYYSVLKCEPVIERSDKKTQPVLSFSPGNSISESGEGDGALMSGDGIGLTSFSEGIRSSRRRFKFFTRLPKFL